MSAAWSGSGAMSWKVRSGVRARATGEREPAGARGGAGAAEAGEDLEQHVVGEGADAVGAVVVAVGAAAGLSPATGEPHAAAC